MHVPANVPRLLGGKYRIERLLGHGGMGSVYQALDVPLARPVAIKVIRGDLLRNESARRRFQLEAQTLANLQHPSIVDVFDYGTLDDGSPYLVMEFVRGEDLRRVLVREGRIEPERGRRILAAVCAAMEAAHREAILHCDLKPENILLPDDGVEAKVLDFGVARAVGIDARGGLLAGGAVRTAVAIDDGLVGTPAYMAPEQLRGETPDPRTDVFSLGVIAYEMLAGALPFGGGSVAEVVLAQAHGLPPAAVDALPAAWSRAVRSALALDADRRPPSPQALAHLFAAAGGL
jgi:serine/threonine-protein kinase